MEQVTTIDVSPRHLAMLSDIFARHAPNKEVWAYGSRVQGRAKPHSDVDCVIFQASDSELLHTQEALNESDIPYKVQLLRWEAIPKSFQQNITQQYYVLRKGSAQTGNKKEAYEQ